MCALLKVARPHKSRHLTAVKTIQPSLEVYDQDVLKALDPGSSYLFVRGSAEEVSGPIALNRHVTRFKMLE